MAYIDLQVAKKKIFEFLDDPELPYFDTLENVKFTVNENQLTAEISGLCVPNTNREFDSFTVNIIDDSIFVDFGLKNFEITADRLNALNRFNSNALYHTAALDHGILHIHFGNVGMLDIDYLTLLLGKGIFEFLMKEHLVKEIINILNT